MYTLCGISSSRENWPKILTKPVAVISIHVEGMTDIPGLMAYNHLYSWLYGNVIHFDLDFYLDDVPHNDFETRLDKMLCFFESGGDFKEYIDFSLVFSNTDLLWSIRWSQFFVFITTHSDPTNGFLHIGPNNVGAVPPNEVRFSFIHFLTISECYSSSSMQFSPKDFKKSYAEETKISSAFCHAGLFPVMKKQGPP